MKIAVIGIGYVGLSNAIVLAQHNEVVLVDVIEEKVNKINLKKSPIAEPLIVDYLEHRELNLSATLNLPSACIEADFVLVATPTDYNNQTDSFDTSSVKEVVKKVSAVAPQTTIIIKSTVPLGFTEKLIAQGYKNIIFVPEFLREGRALYDNLYPSRLVIGDVSERGKTFAQLMMQGAIKKDIPVLYTQPTEAEAIKLFANTYLAMRVAFFNELDSYAWENGLDSRKIIEGVGLDPRIGSHYCNPSFGYGGYCLPKDSKQLLANYEGVPSALIKAIVDSNDIRKEYVAERVKKMKCQTVGIYRLIMKSGSDNFRSAAIFDIMDKLESAVINILVYEPTVLTDNYGKFKIIHDLNEFKDSVDIILANRFDQSLADCKEKLLTRDIFGFE